MITGMAHSCVGSMTSAITPATATASTAKLSVFCSGKVMGRCASHLTSCSFPAAISEPVKTSDPSTISMPSTAMTNQPMSGWFS